jgi:hypothetical protein
MKTACVVVLLVTGAVTPASAEWWLSDAENHKVRVWAPEKVEGRLVTFDAHSVTVQRANGDPVVIERLSIAKMEADRGAGFRAGMATAGAGAGAVLVLLGTWFGCGFASVHNPEACDNFGTGEFLAATLGAAAVGGVATGLATRSAGWTDVAARPNTEVAVRLAPQRQGLGVQVALRF